MNMVLPQSNIQSYNISYVPNQYATNTALSTGVPFISSNSNLQQNSTNNWTQNGNLFNYQLAASNTNWSFYQQDENTYPHTTQHFQTKIQQVIVIFYLVIKVVKVKVTMYQWIPLQSWGTTHSGP